MFQSPQMPAIGGYIKRQRTRDRERPRDRDRDPRPASRYSAAPARGYAAAYRADTFHSDAYSDDRPRLRGKQLSFGIDLRLARRRPLDEEQGLPERQERRSLDIPEVIQIIQTRHFLGENGRDIVKLTVNDHEGRGSEKDDELATDTRWIHIKSDCMDFDAFQAAAREIQGLQDDDIGLIMRLLRKVRAKNEKRFVNGRYIEPIAMGVSGSDPDHGEAAKSVVFFCLPYVSLDPFRPSRLNRDSLLHPTRTLLQSHYRLESTAGRDKGQVVQRLGSQMKDHILHVPHIWCLLINNSTIVTCAPMAKDALFRDVIQTVPYSRAVSTEGPSTVRFVDLEGRLYFFPIERCKTWFELAEQVQQANPEETMNLVNSNCGFTLVTKDDHTVTDKNWRAIVGSTKSAFIRLYLQAGPSPDPSSPSDLDASYGSESEISEANESQHDARPSSEPSPDEETYERVHDADWTPQWTTGHAGHFPIDQDGVARPIQSLTVDLLSKTPFNIAQDFDYKLTYMKKDLLNLNFPRLHDSTVEISDFLIYWKILSSREMADRALDPTSLAADITNPHWVGHSALRMARQNHMRAQDMRIEHRTRNAPYLATDGMDSFQGPYTENSQTVPPGVERSPSPPGSPRSYTRWTAPRFPRGPVTFEYDNEAPRTDSPPRRKRTVDFSDNVQTLESPPSPSDTTTISNPRGYSYRREPFEVMPERRDSWRHARNHPGDLASQGYEYVVPNRSNSWGVEPIKRGRDLAQGRLGSRNTSLSRSYVRVDSEPVGVDMDYRRSASVRPSERRRFMGGSSLDLRSGQSDHASLSRNNMHRERPPKKSNDIYYVPPTKEKPPLPSVSIPREDSSVEVSPGPETDRITAEMKRKSSRKHHRTKPQRLNTNPRDDCSNVRSRSGSDGSAYSKPQIYPVFTWPTAKPASNSTESVRNSAFSTEDTHVDLSRSVNSAKDAENKQRRVPIDDDTLALILQDAHEKLMTSRRRIQSNIYERTEERTVQEVEDLLQQLEARESEGVDFMSDVRPAVSIALRKRKDFVSCARDLSDAFVPANYPCAVTNKYWGAIYRIVAENELSADHFSILHRECLGLLKLMEDIQNGVAAGSGPQSFRYQIPIALVQAYQHIVLLFAVTAATVPSLNDDLSTREQRQAIHVRSVCLIGAEDSLKEGKFQLILMINTDEHQQGVGYEAVSSRALTTLVMERLLEEPEMADILDLTDMYGQYLGMLEAQVQLHPSVRLFEDIKWLREELEIVRNTFHSQHQVLEDYMVLVGLADYPRDWKTDNLAGEVLMRSIETADQRVGEVEELLDRAGNIQFLTTQSISLKAESNNKAILLFTLVTLIFLPLSFITSYLGMNTVDIRDSSSGQGLFWAIALPLTCVIFLIALFFAYQRPWARNRRSAIWKRWIRWKRD